MVLNKEAINVGAIIKCVQMSMLRYNKYSCILKQPVFDGKSGLLTVRSKHS